MKYDLCAFVPTIVLYKVFQLPGFGVPSSLYKPNPWSHVLTIHLSVCCSVIGFVERVDGIRRSRHSWLAFHLNDCGGGSEYPVELRQVDEMNEFGVITKRSQLIYSAAVRSGGLA
nr:hypothetical transcript [Hymenolepis microstoma]